MVEGVGDAHLIITHVGVAHEVAADHPFVVEVTAKGVAHAAVDGAEVGSSAHGADEGGGLLLGERAHRPARKDQVVSGEFFGGGDAIEGVFDAALEAERPEGVGKKVDDFFRMMTTPAAGEKESLFHGCVL